MNVIEIPYADCTARIICHDPDNIEVTVFDEHETLMHKYAKSLVRLNDSLIVTYIDGTTDHF